MRTSLYSILCIVIRVGAILLFVQTAVGLPAALSSLRGEQFGPGAEGMLIGFSGVLVGLAVALWLYPGLLARLAVTQASRQLFEIQVGAEQLQYIAFAVLGMAFAMNGLIDLVGVGMRAVLIFHLHDPAFENMRREDWARVVTQTLKLVLGVVLVFGSRGLAGLLRRLRETALPPAQPADSREADLVEPK